MSARSRANAILRESLAPLIQEYKPGDLVLTSIITAKVPAINYHIRPSPQRVGALMKERKDLESVQPGVWRKVAEAEA
jgi:hypothetical protein